LLLLLPLLLLLLLLHFLHFVGAYTCTALKPRQPLSMGQLQLVPSCIHATQ
jgi:hypothetical protein